MKHLLAILLLAATGAAQTMPAAPATSLQTLPGGLVINLSTAQMQEPGVQRAVRLLDDMVKARGGPAWMNLQDVQQVGRTYSFYHGESSGAGAPFWRFWKWPDRERVE